jgi:hypothetical protein
MRSNLGTFCIAIGFSIASGRAQTNLEASHGWGGRERAGRWNPLLVRASDRPPRDVVIDVNSATDGGFGTTISEHVAIGPTKGTFELYAPSHYAPSSQGVVVIRDADSGRSIAQSPAHLTRATARTSEIGPSGIFIGISGKPAELQSVRQSGLADAGYLPPRFLPRSPIGFDGIECLFLNQPAIDALEGEQQQAILSWVRAGGSLLVAPSDGPIPIGSPLLAALPCVIGDLQVNDLTVEVLSKSGLPPRFALLTSRRLTPAQDAHRLELISGSKIVGYWGQYGLGRIFVAPIDLASIEFDPAQVKEKSRAFWGPILIALTGEPAPQPKRQYDSPYYGYQSESEDQEREGAAVGTLCDFVAGSGSSDPRRVPLVLVAILMIVGPIDSIVLFARGSRPWTWSTATGWVALLAAAVALVLPHFRSVKFECRSVCLIDQVDEATIATTELVGVTSSGRVRFDVGAPASSGRWWQPAIPGLVISQDLRPQADLDFHQSDTGNQPVMLVVDSGQPRFLRGDQIGSALPVMKVDLSLRGHDRAAMLVGSVQNLSAQPLTGIRIRTRLGVVSAPSWLGGRLMPGQVLEVKVPATGEPFAPQKLEAQYQSFGYFGSRHLNENVAESNLWAVAPDLSGRRSLKVDDCVDRLGDYCCVYAESASPPAVFFGSGGPYKEQAYRWVRALAPLRP